MKESASRTGRGKIDLILVFMDCDVIDGCQFWGKLLAYRLIVLVRQDADQLFLLSIAQRVKINVEDIINTTTYAGKSA